MTPSVITLIIPPSPFLLDERVFPFLGITKVAAVLIARGWEVELLDLSGIENYLDVVKDHVQRTKARLFGCTATTPQFPATVRIATLIREYIPDARTIIGGTHATLTVAGVRFDDKHGRHGRAHHALEQLYAHFDVIVAGDGEESIFLALEDEAPRLIDGDDRKSPLFLTNIALDNTPFPARQLLDMESYHYFIDGVRATSLIAQLGCPYKCGFCAGRSSPMLRNIRMRSDENIVAELTLLADTYGYQGYMFYDDELNVNTGMIALMEKIEKVQRDRGESWKLRGFIKSERFTDEQAQAMYLAGFRQLLIGFESGSPRILHNIQKIATQEDNSRCMDIARKHGLRVKALMSLGHPGESAETVEETKRWLIAEKPSDFDATIITPYPGSPYYDEALPLVGATDIPVWVYTAANSDRLYQTEVDYTQEADYYKGDPEDGYVSHVWTDRLRARELVEIRNTLEAEVRSALGIAYNPSAPATLYEHSMGQTQLPSNILRIAPAKPR